MAFMVVQVLRHLKVELAWAVDKWLQVISNIMLFKTVISVRNLRKCCFKFEEYCMHCYVVLTNVYH